MDDPFGQQSTHRSRNVALRAVRGANFFLEAEGKLWMVTDLDSAVLEASNRGDVVETSVDQAFAVLGMRWQVDGTAEEVVLSDGDRLEVWAEAGTAARPSSLAGYRDDFMPSLQSSPERPMLVVLTSRGAKGRR